MLEMNPRQISVHGSTYAPVSKMDTQRRKGEKPHNIKETKTQWLFKWTVHQWVSCQRQDRPWLALTNAWNVTEVLVWRMKIENITTPPTLKWPPPDNWPITVCKVGMLVRMSAWKVTKKEKCHMQHSDIRKMWARGLQIWQALAWKHIDTLRLPVQSSREMPENDKTMRFVQSDAKDNRGTDWIAK